MQIAQSKTREEFPLSPKKIIKKTLSNAIGGSIFLETVKQRISKNRFTNSPTVNTVS